MTMSSESSKRSGRRPGPTTTREAIAEAARRQFAELGYDRATMRGIAGEAGVDAALVMRFYGSKEALFREVMALPPMVAEAIAGLADGPRETVGRRLAEAIVGMLENPALARGRPRPDPVGRTSRRRRTRPGDGHARRRPARRGADGRRAGDPRSPRRLTDRGAGAGASRRARRAARVDAGGGRNRLPRAGLPALPRRAAQERIGRVVPDPAEVAVEQLAEERIRRERPVRTASSTTAASSRRPAPKMSFAVLPLSSMRMRVHSSEPRRPGSDARGTRAPPSSDEIA